MTNHFDTLPNEIIPLFADNIATCVALAATCARFRRVLEGKTYPLAAPWWIPATFDNTIGISTVYKAGCGVGRCMVPVSPAYIRRTAPKVAWGRLTGVIPVPRDAFAELTEQFQAQVFKTGKWNDPGSIGNYNYNISIRNFNAICGGLKPGSFSAFSPYAPAQ